VNGYDDNGGRRGGDLQRTDEASTSPQALTVDETSPDRVPFHEYEPTSSLVSQLCRESVYMSTGVHEEGNTYKGHS
jgi:hypothetical protein